MSPGETCAKCEHSFDAHAVIPTTSDPLDGGIMLCPEPGCRCFHTWSPTYGPPDDRKPVKPGRGADGVYLPPMDVVETMRTKLQAGEL